MQMHITIIGEVGGYKIKEPWTWKRVKDLLIILSVFIIVITIIWFFPPTHKLIMDFYEGNEIIKTIVDIIGKILLGIINGIISFFKK